MDFNKPIHVHFIGIGGISMSALAEILLSAGNRISGSDLQKSDLCTALSTKGARIFCGHRAENLDAVDEKSTPDLVVYTAAITEDNPELMAAKERGLPLLTRAQLLGQIMRNYHTPIAVAGTHGKTSTTGMISAILLSADRDPTLTVGGILDTIGGNLRIGRSGYFVTEACEYTDSYLSFFPKIGVILNIEADHLDFFADLAAVRASFRQFAALIPADGALVINGDIPGLDEITDGLTCRIITFGLSAKNDYHIHDISYDELARPRFYIGNNKHAYPLLAPGEHNVMNAAAAIAVAEYLDIPDESIRAAVAAFRGIRRRFELRGTCRGFTIIDDYAHHPTEIAATLKTARRYPHREIYCVFQPHTYTRTHALLDDFAEALLLADKVVVIDIYAAREKNQIGISSKDLAEAIARRGGHCVYIPSTEGDDGTKGDDGTAGDDGHDRFWAAEKYILKNLLPEDLLITMGAGDVVCIADNLLEQ